MTTPHKPTPGFYGRTLFVIPVLNWKIVETPQGWSYEFADGTHGWPDPTQKQLIKAYETKLAEYKGAGGLSTRLGKPQRTQTANLPAQVREFERNAIRTALVNNDLNITKAAAALGLANHGGLLAILNGRHKCLREELGIVPRVRRRPAMNKPDLRRRKGPRQTGQWEREAL